MKVRLSEGFIFDIHRGTTHDGPGMRTSVFFKGCPLHCAWCHNPESINPNPVIQWTKAKCIGCMICKTGCSAKAIICNEEGIKINQSLCKSCYTCVMHCPSKALVKVGELWNVENLVKEACKDEMFFEDFDGGVTVSGGEPILQYQFLVEFLKKLKMRGIHTALDTSGFGKREAFMAVYPYVDTFLFDIKFMDEKEHISFTGVSNKLILNNLKIILDQIQRKRDTEIWIRTPLIPGATATEYNISQIGDFIQREMINEISRWELCTFNNVCRDKYKKLNLDWKYANTQLMKQQEVNSLANIARIYVGDKVIASGLTGK